MAARNHNPWKGITPPKLVAWNAANIAPYLAALAKHPEKQRRRKPGHIAAIRRDIENERFDRCYSPVVIDKNGFVIDGQHRLAAIAGTNKTVWLWTIYEAPPKDIFHFDLDVNTRSPYVQANLVKMFDRDLNASDVAVTSFFFNNPYKPHRGRVSQRERLASFDKHREAVDFAQGCFGKLAPSPVRGTVAVAFEWGADPGYLTTFATVFTTGAFDKSEPEQQNAILLRKYLLQQSVSTSRAGRVTVYKRTCRALSAYLDGEVLTRLHEAGSDPFPLDDDA